MVIFLLQVAELQKRVLHLRSEAPKQLTESLNQYFQNSRPQVAALPPLDPVQGEAAVALTPAPASLQASLAKAAFNAPILRCDTQSLVQCVQRWLCNEA